jgi:hypothetical protein
MRTIGLLSAKEQKTMLDRRLVLCALSLSLPAVAQLPVLAPTASTTIDVDATFGLLSYASIAIPAGVTVRFTGHHPVRITVPGNVRVDGELSVASTGSVSGPGGVTTGIGFPGFYNWVPGYWDFWTYFPQQVWVSGYYSGFPGGDGRHASMYGSALPFDLAGGSPGGGAWYQPYWGMYEVQPGGNYPGGGGGGTLVVEAAGRVEVFGLVNANGAGGGTAGRGSGGSILLRGLLGCSIATGASVIALPEGIVRLDAYDLAPQVNGTVQPSPTIVRYPDLTETQPPVLGRTWQLRVATPRGDVVFLAASCQPGSGTNQYGHYGIDLSSAITFAVVTVPSTGHDPLGTFQLSVPNAPQFAGLPLYVQGLDWFTSLPPRYTQTVATMVQ